MVGADDTVSIDRRVTTFQSALKAARTVFESSGHLVLVQQGCDSTDLDGQSSAQSSSGGNYDFPGDFNQDSLKDPSSPAQNEGVALLRLSRARWVNKALIMQDQEIENSSRCKVCRNNFFTC